MILAALTITSMTFLAQECPERVADGGHAAAVDSRGDHAMGFDHTKTAHHFLLAEDGGVIEVSANDAADTASRDKIRMHLRHIATKFSEGDFSIPMFIHFNGEQAPPGVEIMKQAGSRIVYTYEETSRGGRVRLRAADAEAAGAVREFLRFQIEDHRTGDPK